ncbi:MAG: hypothetical protein ACI9W2_004590 [Gammaproteobacteria bacterium]|jgi:hypothetical protein
MTTSNIRNVVRNALLLIVTVLITPLTVAQEDPAKPRVIESALVIRAPGSPTAFLQRCSSCGRIAARVTEKTEVIINGERRLLAPREKIYSLADTMYDPRDNTVVWMDLRQRQ